MRKTKVWQPPVGIDMEIDIDQIWREAESQARRSAANSVAPSASPASGSMLMVPHPPTVKAPNSARGRLQDSFGSSRGSVSPKVAQKKRPSSAKNSGPPAVAREADQSQESFGAGGYMENLAYSPDWEVSGPLMQTGTSQPSVDEDYEQVWEADNEGPYMLDVTVPSGPHDYNQRFGPLTGGSRKTVSRKGKRRPTSGVAKAQRVYSANNGVKIPKPKRPSILSQAITKENAMLIIDELRRQQNDHLLGILEEEQAKEANREILMSDVYHVKEKARLEKLFTEERAMASKRIMLVTAEHENILMSKMAHLGLM
mmetsp:Transcript_38463/g.60033  ORF Transcript_38463/g.60033 Transcript_38463/m.60033 type:complete len:313 (+) Transcript_38463:642-1580(+)